MPSCCSGGRPRSTRAPRTVHVVTDGGEVDVGYEQLVVALGAVPRTLPIPGLAEHGARLQVPGRRDPPAQPRPARARGGRGAALGEHRAAPDLRLRRRRLRGRRGARPSSPTSSATRSATTPSSARAPQRWVLVDAAPKILPEIPARARRVRRPRARAAAGSTSGSRRRSSRSTPTAPSSPTAPASRRTRWSGRPA